MAFVHYQDPAARDEAIRVMRHEGESMREIARRVGCSVETVREAITPGLKQRRNRERAAYYTAERQRAYRSRG